MHKLGRLLQLLGLALPPLSIVLQLSNSISVGMMLIVLVTAACLFWIGRIVEGYGGG